MKESAFQRILSSHSPEAMIEILRPFVSDSRKLVIENSVTSRLSSVQVAAESPCDIHNALAICRTAEALGMMDTHIIDPELEEGRGIGTTRGAIRWIHVHRYRSIADFSPEGLVIAGAALGGTLSLEEIPVDRPLLLLFGNEHRGLSPEALEKCHLRFKIPMYGLSDSYNLSVAAAISLYDVCKRRREWLGQVGDLEPEAKLLEMARQYVRTVGVGLSEKLLKCQNRIHA